jgi:hypothetical protein
MSTVKLSLKELRNADVRYVSLVDRSASRMPFRITKRDDKENTMIDLTRLQVKKAAPVATPVVKVAPSVSSIIVMGKPDAEMAPITEAIKAQGFDVTQIVKNEDGTISYKQDATPEDETVLIRLSENMLVALKGFDPYNDALRECADFNETVAASGFFGGVSTAFDGLQSTMAAILRKADTPDAAVPDIESAVSKFGTYLVTLVSGLPSSAFKVDASLAEIVKKTSTDDNGDLMNIPQKAPEGVAQNDWDKMSPVDKMNWKPNSTNSANTSGAQKTESNTLLQITELMSKAPQGSDGTKWATMSMNDKLAWYQSSYNTANRDGAQDADPAQHAQLDNTGGDMKAVLGTAVDGNAPTAKVEATPVVKTEPVVETTPVVKAEPDAMTALMAVVTTLAGQVGELAKKLDENTQATDSKIDEIARKSQDLNKRVLGTVIAPVQPADRPSGTEAVVTKNDGDPRVGCFDTALIRKRVSR